MRDDTKEMEKLIAAATSNPGSDDVLLSSQSDTEAYYGRLQNARDFTRRAIESGLHHQAKGRAAEWQAHAALREAELGNLALARQQATAALAAGEDIEEVVALALARAGDSAGARTIAGKLAQHSPADLWLNNYWLPSIRAAIEINQKDPARAIEALEITRPYEAGGDPITLDTLYPVYLRGQAYLMQGKGSAAETEFQKIIDHHGRVANGILGVLAYLQLGRAHKLALDTTKARSAYQDFLTRWKGADPEIPLLRQAAAEYSSLH
jgi:hypothetical protein